MAEQMTTAFGRNFLGKSPKWYKQFIVAALLINPILLIIAGPYVTGWVLIAEFIFTLAMALKCYPLQPGGLLAIEAVALGLTTNESVYHEIEASLEVILLLIFMVAGIYFMKNLLLFVFTKILVNVRSKVMLSLLFSLVAAVLSAFLDALTVTAVVIAVSLGFYSIYHKVASGKGYGDVHNSGDDETVKADRRASLEAFRGFLRSLVMHAAVGTALGGVCTLVGEPQNIIIAERSGWDFIEFFLRMAPITMPVLGAGLLTCYYLEKTKKFGYGDELPEEVRKIIEDYDRFDDERRTPSDNAALIVQALVGVWLVIGLALHLAAVGLIGLSVIVLITSFVGITEENQIGHAFEEALPFTALLAVFFAVVAVIHDQGLFAPVINYVLSLEGKNQIIGFFVANGVLSAISDNVFVATVYINSTVEQLAQGNITRDAYDLMAVAINTGTNIPSVATPNGQAAFLFLLTSALAPLIRLSYLKMVMMALPYTISMTITAIIAVYLFLVPVTNGLYEAGVIKHHTLSAESVEDHGGGH
ncbi:MAG: sodium/proton antiporter NhaB [Pseudomonadota bacterium]